MLTKCVFSGHCISGTGTGYEGNVNITASGRVCQHWKHSYPHPIIRYATGMKTETKTRGSSRFFDPGHVPQTVPEQFTLSVFSPVCLQGVQRFRAEQHPAGELLSKPEQPSRWTLVLHQRPSSPEGGLQGPHMWQVSARSANEQSADNRQSNHIRG